MDLPRPSRSSLWRCRRYLHRWNDGQHRGRRHAAHQCRRFVHLHASGRLQRRGAVATYTLTDGLLTSTATLTLSITSVNDAPIGVNDSATTLEDTPVSGNVLTNDTDVDGPSKTVTQFVVGGTTFAAGATANLAASAP